MGLEHDLLFANQNQLVRSNFLQYASQLGLDIDAFTEALDSGVYQPTIQRDLLEARGLGATGTPTFFVNGEKIVGAQPLSAFTAIIDRQLGLGNRSVNAAASADPAARVDEIPIAGAPVRGSPNAPITIVEYSDLACPFCVRALPVLEELRRLYPDQISWVFKHFPLEIHPQAPLAHEAALAAGEQGRFWEMHDAVFANQQALERDALVTQARALGLDVDRFVRDLDSGRFTALVEQDMAEGARLGVSGTPTFFINGRRLVGAHPLAAFRQVIDDELRQTEDAAVPQR